MRDDSCLNLKNWMSFEYLLHEKVKGDIKNGGNVLNVMKSLGNDG